MSTSIEQWAIRHGVSHVALAELRAMWGDAPMRPEAPPSRTIFESKKPVAANAQTEAASQVNARLACTAAGWRVWRNQVGACKMPDGSFVRFGLCNDSAGLNDKFKSSDLIGIRPRLVGPADVGTTIGQFVSLEVKKPGWIYSGTPRETAQLAWLNLIMRFGGHARFSTGDIE